MKKFAILLLILLLPSTTLAATSIPKLSLEAQMKLQEIQNKKVANANRLAELRAQKAAASNTGKISTPSPARLAAQQANLTRLAELRAQRAAGIIPTNTGTTTTVQQSYTSASQPAIPGVDMSRVRSTWIGWYNDYRRSLGLGSYIYDTRLDKTAYSWDIEFARGGGQNHHRRNPNDAYYDYPVITEWFKDRGVVGKVVNGATTTENVGYGTYSCSSSDCTQSLINSIRTTFDFFMSEKSYGGAHYKSIVQPNFTKIGLSIIVEPNERRYYLTVHYITEFQ